MIGEGKACLVVDLKAGIEVESLQQLQWGEEPLLEGGASARGRGLR